MRPGFKVAARSHDSSTEAYIINNLFTQIMHISFQKGNRLRQLNICSPSGRQGTACSELVNPSLALCSGLAVAAEPTSFY
jgi:hypothetical protein